jgi:hypothetical protein
MIFNCKIDDCQRRILIALLKEARQYVSDAGNDEDAETQRNSAELLKQIDEEISASTNEHL